MRRSGWRHLAMVVLSLSVSGGTVRAQVSSSSRDVATAMQDALIETIAGGEKSVVAIALVERMSDDASANTELHPSPFGFPLEGSFEIGPADRSFVPSRYATGVVVDSRGLILTACHVLAEQADYYVTTSDRQVYQAQVRAADPRSDLAVLAINAIGLTPIRFGDSAGLRKGQIVIALGNPHAIARDGQVSASWGIVSNLARKAPSTPSDTDLTSKSTLHHLGTLIQTDAKLNLGTSGGPLLDLDGRMIGLTTSLAALAGYESAAGYAFPVDAPFRRTVEILKQGREVEYGFLGVQPSDLSWEERSRGLRGARVGSVVHGTPADRYGLAVDDIITRVNGRAVFDADSMILEVGRVPVDSITRLDILRAGQPLRLDVGLTKYPVRGRKVVTRPPPDWRGMRVDYTTAGIDFDEWLDLGMRYVDDGVIITEVAEDTPSWQAGLRDGMIISRVDGTAIRSPAQFRAAVTQQVGTVRLRLVSPDESTQDRWVQAGL